MEGLPLSGPASPAMPLSHKHGRAEAQPVKVERGWRSGRNESAPPSRTKRSAAVQQPPSSSSAAPRRPVLLRRRVCQHRSKGRTEICSGQKGRRAWRGPCCHEAAAGTHARHCRGPSKSSTIRTCQNIRSKHSKQQFKNTYSGQQAQPDV